MKKEESQYTFHLLSGRMGFKYKYLICFYYKILLFFSKNADKIIFFS